MENNKLIANLQKTMQALFGNDAIHLTPATTPGDIKGWDSMANVTLAVEIENEFKIRIKPAEMEAIRDVGDLMSLIERRIALRPS